MKYLILFITLIISSSVISQNKKQEQISFAGNQITLPDDCILSSGNVIFHCDGFTIKWSYTETQENLNVSFNNEVKKHPYQNKLINIAEMEMNSFGFPLKGKEIEMMLSDGPYFSYLFQGNINGFYVLIEIDTMYQFKRKSDLGDFASKFISFN